MNIDVPKEIKNHEYRVGLTPASVRELAAQGHQVVVQMQAGHGISASDEGYVHADAPMSEVAGRMTIQAGAGQQGNAARLAADTAFPPLDPPEPEIS